jgi:hypothetical protein
MLSVDLFNIYLIPDQTSLLTTLFQALCDHANFSLFRIYDSTYFCIKTQYLALFFLDLERTLRKRPETGMQNPAYPTDVAWFDSGYFTQETLIDFQWFGFAHHKFAIYDCRFEIFPLRLRSPQVYDCEIAAPAKRRRARNDLLFIARLFW